MVVFFSQIPWNLRFVSKPANFGWTKAFRYVEAEVVFLRGVKLLYLHFGHSRAELQRSGRNYVSQILCLMESV